MRVDAVADAEVERVGVEDEAGWMMAMRAWRQRWHMSSFAGEWCWEGGEKEEEEGSRPYTRAPPHQTPRSWRLDLSIGPSESNCEIAIDNSCLRISLRCSLSLPSYLHTLWSGSDSFLNACQLASRFTLPSASLGATLPAIRQQACGTTNQCFLNMEQGICQREKGGFVV